MRLIGEYFPETFFLDRSYWHKLKQIETNYFFLLLRRVFLKLKTQNSVQNKVNLQGVLNALFILYVKWIRFFFNLKIATESNNSID